MIFFLKIIILSILCEFMNLKRYLLEVILNYRLHEKLGLIESKNPLFSVIG